MPPLTRLRVGSLEALAAQMRFAPPAVLRRQAFAAEALAAEIDPGRNYTLGWVARRLTGYRLDAGDLDAEEVIVGAALVAELPAMVERLSDRAGLTADDLGPGALTLAALCARWGVDRKTIERRRRQGLIGFRVGTPGRSAARKRVMFRLGTVERFEAGMSASRRPLRRIRGAEADRIAALASRCRRRFGWTMHRTAERLAARTGRSVEGVRGLLARRDAGSAAPMFTERGPLNERDRAVIERALRRGIPADALAARIGRTRASIHRAGLEARAAFLRTLELSGPVLPTFARSDAAEVLLAPRIVRSGAALDLDRPASAIWSEARSLPAPDEAEEHSLAAAMAFLRNRARRAIAALPAHAPASGAIDEIETDLRWHWLVQRRLARLGLRLALLTIEERLGAPVASLGQRDSSALLGIAAKALLSAAWGFDPATSGERFSAAATAALLPALARPGAREALRRGAQASAQASPARARKPADGAAASIPSIEPCERSAWSARLDAPRGLRHEIERRAWLTTEQADALALRFGAARGDGTAAPPHTRAAAARAIGRSAVWLARLEHAAWRRGLGLPARALLHPRPASRSSTSSR